MDISGLAAARGSERRLALWRDVPSGEEVVGVPCSAKTRFLPTGGYS